MAYESQQFDKNGNNTRCIATLYYQKNESSASFYVSYTGYCGAGEQNGNTIFWGNSNGYIRLNVDGTETARYTYATTKSYGTNASKAGWIKDQSGSTSTITLPAKNTGYKCYIYLTGNFSATPTKTVTYTFTIPVFVNANGTIKACEKAYANIGGAIKECTVYINNNGTIYALQ